jgi:hypothetical protein
VGGPHRLPYEGFLGALASSRRLADWDEGRTLENACHPNLKAYVDWTETNPFFNESMIKVVTTP